MSDPRKATNRLLDMVNDGVFDPYDALLACLSYMSEDEVADMCHSNGYFEDDDEEEDADDDETL